MLVGGGGQSGGRLGSAGQVTGVDFFFFFWNPNLYPARVQQRYRSGHVSLRSAIMNVDFWKEPA